MLENIDGILEHTDGLDFGEIAASYVLMRATERGLRIISEAAKELPPEVRALEPDVPWTRIIAIGNYLRHEYYRISPSDIQSVIEVHLPALRPAVMRLLDRVDDPF